jgi:Fic family protein
MPSHQETHPYIDFRLDKLRLREPDWMNLGEARSKCAHLAGVPIQPEVALRLAEVTLIKGAVATTAIEGNTLTEEEVQQYLDGESTVERSRQYQLVDVENVLGAIREIDRALQDRKPIPLSIDRLLEVNRKLLVNTEHESSAEPGAFRQHSVVVGGGIYRGPDWEHVPELCRRMCYWMSDLFDKEVGGVTAHSDDERIAIALVKAIVAHIYIAWIHPFGDGNGRTARLIEVQILSQAGVPLVATNLLSDHYNRTRDRYYRELRIASESGGNMTSFVSYAIEGFVDGLRKQIRTVRDHQLEIAWKNHVHELVEGNTLAMQRRRWLLLDMPLNGWVKRSEIAQVSTRVAHAYGGKGLRTLPRDLNALLDRELIVKRRSEYRVAVEKVVAFVPTFDHRE